MMGKEKRPFEALSILDVKNIAILSLSKNRAKSKTKPKHIISMMRSVTTVPNVFLKGYFFISVE